MPTAWLDRMLATSAFPEFYDGRPDMVRARESGSASVTAHAPGRDQGIVAAVDACSFRIREAWHAVGCSERALWITPGTQRLVSPSPRLYAEEGPDASDAADEVEADGQPRAAGSTVPALRRWQWMFGQHTGAEAAAEARFWEEAAARWGPAQSSSGGGGGSGWDWRWGDFGSAQEEEVRRRQRRTQLAWLMVAVAGGVALWRAYKRRWRCQRCGGHLDRVATSDGADGWVGASKPSRWREVAALPVDAAEMMWEETCTPCQRRERELDSARFDINTCASCGAHSVRSIARPGWRRCSSCTCVAEQEVENKWEYRAYACENCGQCVAAPCCSPPRPDTRWRSQ